MRENGRRFDLFLDVPAADGSRRKLRLKIQSDLEKARIRAKIELLGPAGEPGGRPRLDVAGPLSPIE
jgi:hypothetical protein